MAIIIPGRDLSQPATADDGVIAVAAHGQLDRVGDQVAADQAEERMPSWPMAMPSVTVMVQNSRGVAPAAFTPSAHRMRLAHQGGVARGGFVPARGDADERLGDFPRAKPHGVVIGAMRRARRSLGDMAAGKRGLVPRAVGVPDHIVSPINEACPRGARP